ncbi:MAG: class I SAM-dependent methyltransferase [Lachnospiraceae bacterium]|nr:class I SAM-dependent methyltransferase [Lachnospiraceae bacterium]
MKNIDEVLNLKFYSGVDSYSDGDMEEDLLRVVRECEDYEDFLKGESDWTFLYHLSPIRENLLDWYEFRREGTLLEIGSGCGALTGLFCSKVRHVTGIDLSKRRSLINAHKNKDCDNLEIYVGNFVDIALDEKFDYVTLIGVLEYSCYYLDSEDPFGEMIRRAKAFLKPGGTLIIAIENKYGLKYWAGAPEDHTGLAFEGITGYHGTDRVRTFSRNGIERLIKGNGFSVTEFYYPLPDYKLPDRVYSEKNLPGPGAFGGVEVAYDRERYGLFDEALAFDEICKDGLFTQFANSFLVFCKV